MRIALAAAVATVLVAVSSAGSATRPRPAALIEKGLAQAVAGSRLPPDEAAGYRATLTRAQAAVKQLPPLRAALLEGVIGDVASQWRAYNHPRALTLFSTLAVNRATAATNFGITDQIALFLPNSAITVLNIRNLLFCFVRTFVTSC